MPLYGKPFRARITYDAGTNRLRVHVQGLYRTAKERLMLDEKVDVAHWASEWPWCDQAAGVVTRALGGSVEVLVSRTRTDPWTTAATHPETRRQSR